MSKPVTATDHIIKLAAEAGAKAALDTMVFIHYLVVQGCVDEDVMAVIRDRADTHEAVMRALKARIKKVHEQEGFAV